MTDVFVAGNRRKFKMDGNGYVSGLVLVDVNELISSDFEQVLDMFSDRLVGNELLSDISNEVAGAEDGMISLRVTGSLDMILDRGRDDQEPDDVPGAAPAP